LPKRIELIFDFDVASPYTYVASQLVPRFTAGFDIDVIWRPVLLGGIFKSSGNIMPGQNQQKAKYMLRELNDLAAFYRFPFQFSPHFPSNSLLAQRVICAWNKPETLHTAARMVFAGVWRSGADMTKPEVLMELLRPIEPEVEQLLERATTPEVKQKLIDNTAASTEAGVFGLPAFHVGDRWWWGHDRIMLTIRHIKSLLAEQKG
jgi:2-hydroxychromene-2-carboxylate isomerase